MWWFAIVGCTPPVVPEDTVSVPVTTEPSTPVVTEPSCPTPLAVEPGTGLLAYEPLLDGDPLVVYHGAAGGYWFVLAGRVHGAVDEIVMVSPSLFWPAGEVWLVPGEHEALEVPMALEAYDASACTGDFRGIPTPILVFGDDPGTTWQQFVCSVEGQALELTITVTDLQTEESTAATVQVVAEMDPSVACE